MLKRFRKSIVFVIKDFKIIREERFRRSVVFFHQNSLKHLQTSIYELNKLMTNLLLSILLMLNKIKRKKLSE